MATFKQKGSQFLRVNGTMVEFGRDGLYSTEDKAIIAKLTELGYEDISKPKTKTKEKGE